MEEKNNPTDQNSIDGIDQIREIILGEQILNWDARFKKLEQTLKDLDKNLESKFSSLTKTIEKTNESLSKAAASSKTDLAAESKELANQLKKLKTELGKKIDHLTENKVDKDSIGEVFIQWGQKVKSK